jgi:hydroxyethylthiazole kinase
MMSVSDLSEFSYSVLQQIAEQKVRVHCLTNTVAEPITANVLLSLGAVPSLSSDPDEIPDFLRTAQSLMVNLGTPGTDRFLARRMAASSANNMGMPWVLDPVMVDRSGIRRAEAIRMIKLKPTVVRCNAGEASTLAETLEEFSGILAGTGAVDRLRSHDHKASLTVGHPLLPKVTATGCALSAGVAAFLACHREDRFQATLAALAAFGAAGAYAGERAQGPGSFAVALLDAFPNLTAEFIEHSIEALHVERLERRA